ncbi:MAG: hypothetical protein KDB73_19695 [Planctomycetes bacterium]|nr:hypothetical protein [Planctomycetota bacterium]
MRWVGAILIGLGLVLGAFAVDRLPSMRLDSWASDAVTLQSGAEVRLDYSLGMEGGRIVDLIVDAPEGAALPAAVPGPDVTWSRARGSQTVASGEGPLPASSSVGGSVLFHIESFSTEGDEQGAIFIRLQDVPEALAGGQATIELSGPAYAGFAIADAAVLTIPLAVGALFALLTGLLLLLLPRDALAELATRSPGDPRAPQGARNTEESGSARASGAAS